jgi:hypothetical protein
MKTLRIGFSPVVIVFLLCLRVCNSQDFASDFQKALDIVSKQAKWPSGIMYYLDMEDATDFFVSKYIDSSTVAFLESKIQDPNSQKLGLLCLAKLTQISDVAKTALYQIIYNSPQSQRDAVTVIAYIDPNTSRPIAEKLLMQSGPWRIRVPACQMLIGLGDQSTLDLLKQLVADEKNFYVKQALESAIAQLEYRLTQVPPAKQAEWANYEILCWRTVRETPPPRAVDGEKQLAAQTLHAQGYVFTDEYLQYKLARRDLISIALIGNQKKTWAVPILGKHAVLGDSLGDFSRSALAKIRTSEALRALENAILPGGNSRANTQLLISLQQYGDDYTIEFMENLSKDERFSERERDALIYAYKIIESRLSGNGSPRSRGR